MSSSTGVVGSAHAVMTKVPVYGAQATAHSDSHAGGTRCMRVSAAGMRLAIAYVPTENGRVIRQLQRRLRRRHGEGGGGRSRRASASSERPQVMPIRSASSAGRFLSIAGAPKGRRRGGRVRRSCGSAEGRTTSDPGVHQMYQLLVQLACSVQDCTNRC